MVRRVISNIAGLSFSQVILSLALFSILLMTALKILDKQTELDESSSFYFDSLDIMDQIKSNLHDPRSCLMTLENQNAQNGKINSILKFTSIASASAEEKGEILFKVGEDFSKRKSVSLVGIELLVDRPGFNKSNGMGIIHFEFKGVKAESFSSEFPLRIQYDSKDRIIGCQSSTGLLKNDSSLTPTRIWLEANEVTPFRGGIYSPLSSYQIGEVKEVGALNIRGGLKIGNEKRPCSSLERGSLRFSQESQRLYLCDDTGVWKTLNRSAQELTSKESFEVISDNSEIKVLTTKKDFKLCRVANQKFQAGQCWSKPVSSGEVNTAWELVSQYFRGAPLKCQFDCYH